MLQWIEKKVKKKEIKNVKKKNSEKETGVKCEFKQQQNKLCVHSHSCAILFFTPRY